MMPRITPQPGKLWKKTMYLIVTSNRVPGILWDYTCSYLDSCPRPAWEIWKSFGVWCPGRKGGREGGRAGWLAGRRQKTLKWSSIHLKTMGQYGIDYNSAPLLLLWITQIHSQLKTGSFVLIKWCRISNQTCLLFMKVFKSNILHLQVWINLARWICPSPLLGPGKPLLFSTMDS